MKTKKSESDYTKELETITTNHKTIGIKRSDYFFKKKYNWKYIIFVTLIIMLFVILITNFEINFNYDAS